MPGGAGYPRLPEIVERYAEVVDTREDAGMTALARMMPLYPKPHRRQTASATSIFAGIRPSA